MLSASSLSALMWARTMKQMVTPYLDVLCMRVGFPVLNRITRQTTDPSGNLQGLGFLLCSFTDPPQK